MLILFPIFMLEQKKVMIKKLGILASSKHSYF